MSLPSDLLSAYMEALANSQEGEATTDEDQAEEVLAATLSSCSDLANLGLHVSPIGSTMAPTESTRKEHHCCSSILGPALFDGVEIEAGGNDGDGDEKEWNASIKLLRLILALPESVVGDKATKRSNIAPHMVMRAVMDHSLDCCDFEGDDEYHDDESVDDNMCGSSCAIDTKTILLILLSSASVRLTASDIRQTLASSSDSKIRWRRASSLAMECIGLYQRLVLERLERNCRRHQGARGNSYNEECSAALIDSTTLLSKYVADAIFSLLDVFQEHYSTAPVEKIEVGLISATSTATKFINIALAQHNPMLSHQLSLDLITSCISPLYKIQLDTILINPLRRWDYDRMTQNGDVDDSSYSSDDDEESDADARPPGEIFAEMVCGHSSGDNPGGMKTYWDGLGIAFLAHHIVTARAMLPLYSPAFYFVLLYPHSGVLLHLGQNDDEQLGSGERSAIIANGIGMLDAALELSNGCCPTNESMPYAHISQDVESPLGPVGTTQLLLNTALALPDTVGSLTNGIGECQIDQTKITKSKILWTCRKLLLCYPPLSYVRSVASLLQCCPFDYLKPVLLDLLRPALLKAADTVETKADEEVERETLDLLESCVLEEMRNHIATSDGDGSDVSSGRNLVLVDIDGLVSRVEQYTCAVSLVRLLLIRQEGRAHEEMNSTVNALNRFHGGLCLLLDDEAFTDLFQFHLLADALGELERQATATAMS